MWWALGKFVLLDGLRYVPLTLVLNSTWFWSLLMFLFTPTVLPAPLLMLTIDERLINQAKVDLKVNHTLDPFQIQSLLGKYIKNNHES